MPQQSCFYFAWLKLPAGSPWSVGSDCNLMRIMRLVGNSFSQERDSGMKIKPQRSLKWKWQSWQLGYTVSLSSSRLPRICLWRLLLSKNLKAGLNCLLGPSKSTLIPITARLEHPGQFNHFPLCVYICLKLYENKNSPFKKRQANQFLLNRMCCFPG